KPVIQAFFCDGWKHKRVEFELSEAARISMQTSAAGKASAESRRKKNAGGIKGSDPTTAGRPSNARSTGQSNETPPSSPSHLHSRTDVDGGKPAAQPSIVTAEYDLAKQIAAIAGQAEEFEMTGWGGATHRAQVWLNAGWPKNLIIEAVTQIMRSKRDGP